MTNKKNLHITVIVFLFLMFAITAFASGCACRDTSIVGIKVVVEEQEITEATRVVRVQGKTNFDLTKVIKVYSIHTSGEEKPVPYIEDNGKGFEIVASLPNPLKAGAYDIVVKYEDYGSYKFRLVLEKGQNTIKNVSDLDKVYDGLQVNAPTFDLDFEQETKIEYFLNTGYGTTQLSQPPTNAGSYMVKITALANNFVVERTFVKHFEISKVTPIEASSHPSFNVLYSPTRTLADLQLNPGYTWINPTETPNAQKNKYEALFNPDPLNYNNVITDIRINVAQIQVSIPNPNLDYTFNGTNQTFDIPENPAYSITNNTRYNAGHQQVTVALKDKINYMWSNATTNDLTFTFEIKKANPTLPQVSTLYANAYDLFSDVALPEGLTWEMENGNNVGNFGNKIFFATFTPTDTTNYNTISGIKINVIVKTVARIPKLKQSVFEYSGTEHSVTFEDFDPELVELEGTTKAILANDYSITASLKHPDLVTWADGTKENKTMTWTIGKIQIELKVKNEYLQNNLKKTYNGNHFYSNHILTSPSNSNYPFEIYQTSTQQDITHIFVQNHTTTFSTETTEHVNGNYLNTYVDENLTELSNQVGTSYVALTYKLLNSKEYSLGATNTQQLIFPIQVQKADLIFNSILYAGNALENNTLQNVEIISNNAKVYANLAENENSTTSQSTLIAGSWQWENPQTILKQSGKHFAVFMPAQNADCFNECKVEVQVEITVNDGISASIIIGNHTAQTIERKGNVFNFTSNSITQKHAIKFEFPEETTATYTINNSNSQTYVAESGIVIDDTLSQRPIYAKDYEIKITLSGTTNKELMFFLSIKQDQCIIKINNQEWDGISGVKTGDVIDVELLNTATANNVKINNSQTQSQIVTLTNGLLNVELLNNQTSILTYSFDVTFVSPFEMIVVDSEQTNEISHYLSGTSSIGFIHRVRQNQTHLNIDFIKLQYNNVSIKYSLDEQNFISLAPNQTQIHNLEISTINTINIKICLNNVEICQIDVYISQFSYIQEIKYVKVGNSAYTTNSKTVLIDSFLTSIEPIFNREDLTYELCYSNGEPLDLNKLDLSASMEIDYILKIYDQNKENLLETQEYKIIFTFVFTTSDTENCTLNQQRHDLFIISNIGTEFTLLLLNSNDNVLLKIFDSNANSIDNHTFITTLNYQFFTFEVSNTVNNVKIVGKIYLYPKNDVNLDDVFTSTSVTFTIPETNEIKTLQLNNKTVNHFFLNANFNVEDIVPLLTNVLNALLKSNEYSIALSHSNELICVKIQKNQTDFAFLYYQIYFVGEKNNNTAIEINISKGVNNDNPQIDADESTKTFNITNIKSSSGIAITALNQFCNLKLYHAESIEKLTPENLIAKGIGSINFYYEQNGTYILEVTSTDRTQTTYYFININGTVETFITVKIDEQSYETFIEEDITGFFQIQTENNTQALVAKLSKDLIQDKTQLELTINTFESFNISDQNENEIIRNQLTTLQITPATQTQSAYVSFTLIHLSENQTLTCIIYFE